LSTVVAMLLSGPGDSTSRSRSLISRPPVFSTLGGSGHDSATLSWPFWTTRIEPGQPPSLLQVPLALVPPIHVPEGGPLFTEQRAGRNAAFTPSTVKVFSVEVWAALSIGASPVPSMS